MKRFNHSARVLLSLALVLAAGRAGAQTQAKSTTDEVRRELLQLPYYGVFDFIAFKYEKGTVELLGYAYHPGLKSDAEHAVKRASGVDQVINKLEELPPSQMDDELRWKTYYAIYRDPFLSKYAPGGGMLWGHRHAPRSGFQGLGFGGFTGMEPAGDYPIHIVVKNGKITLIGVVDNDGDKTIAGTRAREVSGSFGVENDLTVEKAGKSSSGN